jgi:O-6-methylguanine DNA methyltransferase
MGEVVATTEFDSPIGLLKLAATGAGVLRVAFPRESGDGFHGWIQKLFPEAQLVGESSVLDEARSELSAYFGGRQRQFKVPLDLRGTLFQRSVWRVVLEIPFGETRSYAETARAVGKPRAFRAVGAANAANPVPIIVPCHRVIGSGGKLGGFRGGLEVKRRLLALEQSIDTADRLI